MAAQYLSDLNLDLSRGMYMDTGVLFPFFHKDYRGINLHRWANDICIWLKQYDLYTTHQVLDELNTGMMVMSINKKTLKQLRKVYKKIFRTIHRVRPTYQFSHKPTADGLSETDISLIFRPHQDIPLLTSDVLLSQMDAKSVLLRWDVSSYTLRVSTD